MGLRRSVRRLFQHGPCHDTGRCWPEDLKRVLGDEIRHPLLDVGAHRGETVRNIRRFIDSTPVLAFEPVAASFAELARTAARYRGIECHQLALSDCAGTAVMQVPGENTMLSALDRRAINGGHSSHTEVVRTVRLDEFVGERNIEAISALKIDTEGHELHVLRGAGLLLSEGAIQAIIAETTFYPQAFHHTSFFALFEMLSRHGYRFSGLYGMHNLMNRRPRHQFCDALFLLESVIDDPAISSR